MSRKFHIPPVKVYQEQESGIDKIWMENDDVKAVYNMAAALIFTLFSVTIINYFIDPSLLAQDILFWNWMMKNFYQMFLLWSAFKGSSLLVYFTVQWYNQSSTAKLPTVLFVYSLWFIGALFVPLPFVAYGDFSVVLRFAFMMEQSRLLMKVHGFVAEATWMSTKEKGRKITINHYVYYLFAPCLVFRTEYPRTKEVNWNRLFSYASQFLMVVIVDFYTIVPFVQGFSKYGTGAMSATDYMFRIFQGCVLGVLTLFSLWYGILHCWDCMWAEYLQFADRKFYERWWLGNYAKYYRDWNIVVHDWLHNYVYREVIIATSGNRTIGAVVTFWLSAIFHEIVISFSLGFFYPVLGSMYVGLGILIYFMSRKFPVFNTAIGNVFMFFSVFLGWSFQMSFYSSEYYARINCPQASDNFWIDKFTPRSWTCF